MPYGIRYSNKTVKNRVQEKSKHKPNDSFIYIICFLIVRGLMIRHNQNNFGTNAKMLTL